jgi:hypothetical protein
VSLPRIIDGVREIAGNAEAECTLSESLSTKLRQRAALIREVTPELERTLAEAVAARRSSGAIMRDVRKQIADGKVAGLSDDEAVETAVSMILMLHTKEVTRAMLARAAADENDAARHEGRAEALREYGERIDAVLPRGGAGDSIEAAAADAIGSD